MTPEDVAATLDRRKATIAAQRADIATAARAHTKQVSDAYLPFTVGARVFDTVTGQHGQVVGGMPAGAKAGASVQVQLPSGDVVTRAPGHVVPRPSLPPAQ